ncbi:MAG: HisA/HisF family protein [Archaeoglobus sp.]|uniref:HisA/HisF family protein n=1 Tax=Archaeoglobus sp. TaxID=1872626 RepID=UPI001D4CA703|nr:HisA/HisF family protein [Archaeoglobus sp.]MBO8179654.1 HisA/HisF family protein [Archaeoglobus sp.]
MKVFFVVDIKDGKVVAGKSGEREKYPPISSVSGVVNSDDAVEVVEEIRPRFLYAADLDRIMGNGNNSDVLLKLSKRVEELIADCGFRKPEELENLPFTPVVGTETFDITQLDRKCYVSIDFKEKFLDASGKFDSWEEAVEFLNSLSLEGIIVLPIHAVGTMKTDFSILEQALEISEHPILLGGGISGIEDLERLKEMGCSGVLIATAIHKGRIPVSLVRKGGF